MAIRRAGYGTATELMQTEFASRGVYDFCGVPEHVYKGLVETPRTGGSAGRYYNEHIRGRYNCG